jgi:hypothetical protein
MGMRDGRGRIARASEVGRSARRLPRDLRPDDALPSSRNALSEGSEAGLEVGLHHAWPERLPSSGTIRSPGRVTTGLWLTLMIRSPSTTAFIRAVPGA